MLIYWRVVIEPYGSMATVREGTGHPPKRHHTPVPSSFQKVQLDP